MNSETPLSPEQELAAAQQKLEEARQKVAQLDALRLQKAQVELAQKLADEAERLVEQKKEIERMNAKAAARKAEKAAAEEAERRAEWSAKRELEARLAKEEEAARVKREHEVKLAKIDADRHTAEVEAARLSAELARSTPAPIIEQDQRQVGNFIESTVDDSTQGRMRLFQRLDSGDTRRTDGLESMPDEQSQGIQQEYEVLNGKLSPRIFAQRFGIEHRGNFFLSPSTGELILSGYRWALSEAVSNRVWAHGVEVYVALDVDGYELRRVGTSHSVKVTPIDTVEGLILEPLAPKPAPSAAVDQTELLLSDSGPTVSLSF